MRTVLIIAERVRLARRWARILAAARWRVLMARSMADLSAAVYRGADVVLVDADTPQDVRTIAAIQGVLVLPPMLIRASPLAAARPLPGWWRAHLHVGTLDETTLVAAAALLNNAAQQPAITLPVRLPVAPVTKWGVRVLSGC